MTIEKLPYIPPTATDRCFDLGLWNKYWSESPYETEMAAIEMQIENDLRRRRVA